jgi:hypothetical protein
MQVQESKMDILDEIVEKSMSNKCDSHWTFQWIFRPIEPKYDYREFRRPDPKFGAIRKRLDDYMEAKQSLNNIKEVWE